MRITWTEVPEYLIALEREKAQRDCAFFLDRETICGILVLPFTPRHFLMLSNVGCPFLCGGIPSGADIARFLWAVSPGFVVIRPGAPLSHRFRRFRFIRRCKRIANQSLAAIMSIHEYLDTAFIDSPGGSASEGKALDLSIAGFIVHRLASAYGWQEQTILDLPFKRIWQYYRAIAKHDNPEALFINQLTDAAKRMYLAKLLSKPKE